jgi:hypothetical protein
LSIKAGRIHIETKCSNPDCETQAKKPKGLAIQIIDEPHFDLVNSQSDL